MIIAWCLGARNFGGDRPPSLSWIFYITGLLVVKEKIIQDGFYSNARWYPPGVYGWALVRGISDSVAVVPFDLLLVLSSSQERKKSNIVLVFQYSLH